MTADQTLTAIAGELFGVFVDITAALAFLAGVVVAAKALLAGLDIVRGRHDAPRWQEVGLRLVAAAILMAFQVFAASVDTTVGGSQTATTYAAVSFTGQSSADTAAAATFSAGLLAVFEILQIMGTFSQLRGALTWVDILQHKSQATGWRPVGFIIGGAALVHLSTLIKIVDKAAKIGIFS